MRSPRLSWICLATIFIACACRREARDDWPRWNLTGLDGKVVSLFQDPANKACVLIFVSNDCPIANRYSPEIRRLAGEFKSAGFQFVIVHSVPDESPDAVKRHSSEYELPEPVVLDPAQRLARRVGVTHTPEVAVVTQDGLLRYRGRIDDRFVTLGEERPAATRQDLRLAIEAIASGHDPSPTFTTAVGCRLISN